MALTYALTRSWLKALAFILVDYSCVLKVATSIVYILAINERVERASLLKGLAILRLHQILIRMCLIRQTF